MPFIIGIIIAMNIINIKSGIMELIMSVIDVVWLGMTPGATVNCPPVT